MNSSEMAHRWCNLDFGKKGQGFGHGYSSHTMCDDKCYYSYSTIYAMWWDKSEKSKVMIVLDNESAASVTSRKHLAEINSAITPDTYVIRTHYSGSYYSYNSVDFRYGTIWTLLRNLLDNANAKADSLKKANKLNDYTDINTKVNEYLESIKWLYNHKYFTKKDAKVEIGKNRFKLLNVALTSSASQFICHVVGQAELDAYDKRIETLKKAQNTRNLIDRINANYRLNLTAKELRQILKTRNGIKECVTLSCMPNKEEWECRTWWYESDRNHKIVDYWLGDHHNTSKVVNRFTGEIYNLSNLNVDDYSKNFQLRCDIEKAINIYFPYFVVERFKESGDVHNFMRRFYHKCKITLEKDKAVVEYFKSLNGEQCDTKEATWVARKLADYRANEELKKQREAEEKARIEAERQRVLQTYLNMGVEGYRLLWINKYESISEASRRANDDNEFFYGGNVLLRWQSEDVVETSKSIRISTTQAEKMWKVISKWHENPESFKPVKLHTNSGNYTVVSYKNDILTAGCHQIAYCEMARMWNEIQAKQAKRVS